MKCPNCGHDNPDNILFCEECDFRVDQKPPRMSKITKENRPIFLGFGSLVFGIASALSIFIEGGALFAVIFGVIGMVGGGYSMSVVRLVDYPKKLRIAMLVITGIAIVASVVGFLRGFMLLV